MNNKTNFTRRNFFCILAGLFLILTTVVTGYVQQKDKPIVGSDLSIIKISPDHITVEFFPPKGQTGTLEAELYDLGRKLLAKVTRLHKGQTFQTDLFAEINDKDLSNYYLRYRFNSSQQFIQRSLMFLGEILETTVLGQRQFVAGTQPIIRILVRDRSGGVPIIDAQVSVELTKDDKVISKFTGKTDKNGEAAARIQMPDAPLENAKLKINVSSKTAKDLIEEVVQVHSALKTLLTTDKPLYQPGQTIHIRSLTLSQSDMNPLADSDILFEVEDSKGNKVFKVQKKTDRFGISSSDFVLADELNMGSYRIRAIAAGAREEKTVTVERYVLPKFKINLETDRKFYQPGETVKGDIQVDYFFGKPVAGGKVEIKCSKFDVAYTDFQSIEGKTDQKGHYTFETRLPESFVGQPLEAGKASAKFEINVVDTADHKETITKNITITSSPIIVAAVAESGSLIAGLDNNVYIVTTYADSTPAQCKVTWNNLPDGKPLTINTDEAGFGEITIKPAIDTQNISLSLTAKDSTGQTGKSNPQLQVKERIGDDTILLRTNKSLYKAGDIAKLSIFSTRKTGTVYLDIIKDKQTCLTRSLDMTNGKVTDDITLDTSLAGTIQINAYLIGANGVIVRDRRLVLVDPADDLSIKISSDSDTYLPGGDAKLQFRITDKNGRGVASALGVMVVDEAVFALQEMQPGLEKVYFYLEKEIATPRYEIHGYDLDKTFITPIGKPVMGRADRRDTAAKVLLASAEGVGDYSLNINTFTRDNKGQAYQQKMSQQLYPYYQKIRPALTKFSEQHRRQGGRKLTSAPDLDMLVIEGFLQKQDIIDPWGNKLKITGQWLEAQQIFRTITLTSAGIDGKWDTADDAEFSTAPGARGGVRFNDRAQIPFDAMGGGFGGMGRVMDDGKLALAEAPRPMMKAEASKSDSKEGVGAEPVRIRQFFPETLYFNPALITDSKGFASLNIPLADSITTWRLTCMASSLRDSSAQQLPASASFRISLSI